MSERRMRTQTKYRVVHALRSAVCDSSSKQKSVLVRCWVLLWSERPYPGCAQYAKRKKVISVMTVGALKLRSKVEHFRGVVEVSALNKRGGSVQRAR